MRVFTVSQHSALDRFSSGELLNSVNDDDENAGLFFHFGGMGILQLGI